MAYVMEYTDPSGVYYEASYWVVAQVQYDYQSVSTTTVTHGYRDEDAFNQGLAVIGVLSLAAPMDESKRDDLDSYLAAQPIFKNAKQV